MTNIKPTLSSIALGATFKHVEHAKPATNKPTLGKLLEIRRPKRSSGVLFKEIARKFYSAQIGSIKLISI